MIKGIDVSHHQGKIDFKKVKESGIDFVGIKVTQGNHFIDPNFRTNIEAAKSQDLVILLYHFFDPMVDSVEQAKHFLSQLQPNDFPFRPILDCEQAPGWDKIGAVNQATIVYSWLDTVQEALHNRPMFYTNAPFSNEFLQAFAGGIYDLFLARYSPVIPAGWQEWKIWQNTEKGSVPGIDGPVDLDVFKGTKEELQATLATHFQV